MYNTISEKTAYQQFVKLEGTTKNRPDRSNMCEEPAAQPESNLSNAIDEAVRSEPLRSKTVSKGYYSQDEGRYISGEEMQQSIDRCEAERLKLHTDTRLKYKIDVNEVIPKPQIAWSLTNTKTDEEVILGTLGDFGLIIGKAKSRKSFFISIAVSTALGNGVILNRFKSDLPPDKNDVVYFDTEQSKYYVQKAVKRICTQVNQPEPQNLHAFHLRSLAPFERLEFIENEIYSNDKIGFVVIDGIKDLITSINDESEATMIASRLLKWTEERNIYVLTVLHQNKSDTNARGHVGTELINKAQTVLSVTKSESDNNISIVEPMQCRDIEPEIFAFEINEFGIPIIAENFEVRTETKKNKFDATDLEAYKKYQLLTEVFSKGESFSFKLLETQLTLAYKSQFSKTIGINAVGKLITDCKNNDWLLQEKSKGPYTLGEFNGNSKNDCFTGNEQGNIEDF